MLVSQVSDGLLNSALCSSSHPDYRMCACSCAILIFLSMCDFHDVYSLSVIVDCLISKLAVAAVSGVGYKCVLPCIQRLRSSVSIASMDRGRKKVIIFLGSTSYVVSEVQAILGSLTALPSPKKDSGEKWQESWRVAFP